MLRSTLKTNCQNRRRISPQLRRLDTILLETDDEDRWMVEFGIILAGVEVRAVQLDREMHAGVHLADGGWLTIKGDGTDLRDSAYILELLVVDEGHQLQDCIWQGLGVRAIAIENGLPIDPYTIGDM